jgi:TRAP-type uncharacterized transport system fused permease subunit
LGIICLAAAVEGYLIDYTKFYERIPLGIAALLLLKPGLITDAIGLATLLAVYLLQKYRQKRTVG